MVVIDVGSECPFGHEFISFSGVQPLKVSLMQGVLYPPTIPDDVELSDDSSIAEADEVDSATCSFSFAFQKIMSQ